MKTKDSSRKWMWWFLAIAVALQLYFVWELLAAFALFAVGFAAVALLIAGLFVMQKGWELGIARLARSGNPMLTMARGSMNVVEDLARRTLRRPASEPAQYRL